MSERLMHGLVHAVRDVKLNPDPTGLPGSQVLQELVNGLAFWALLAALAGLVGGCIVWAAAAQSSNHHLAGRGRMGTLACAVAALLIGAAPALVNFFADAGQQVK